MIYKIGLRYLLRRPIQSLLCIAGVALGVAVVIAIDLANTSASQAFALSTDTVAGKATHQVIGGVAGLDEDVYRRLKVDLGVQIAAPVVDGYATAIELDQQPLRILGVDIFAEPPFRGYLGSDGTQTGITDFGEFLTSPDALVVGDATAQRYGLAVESQITLRVGDRRSPMRVVGILTPADENSRRALDSLGIMDISAAQELFGYTGRLSHIDLIVDERTEEGRQLLERIRMVLPPDASIVKPDSRSQSVESLTDAFELNLTALSLLALVVGMFLIYNTITFSVVQRRALFGVLRCLGVTRDELLRLVVVESAVLGAIGSTIGLVLGVVLGQGAVALVTQTINDLYYVVTVRSINVEAITLVKGFCLGVGAAVLASLAPAYEASSIQPINALKRSSIEQRVRRILPFVALTGLSFVVIGAVLLLLTNQLVLNLGGIFGVVIGIAFMTPLLTYGLMLVAKPLAGRTAGIIGKLAVGTVVNSISRTAIAIASLMIAVSVIIGLQSMISSFRVTVETWLDATLIADIYVTTPSSGAGSRNNVIADDLPQLVQEISGVSAVTTIGRQPVEFAVDDPGEWQAATLLVVQAQTDQQASSFVWSERNSDDVWSSMRERDEVQVSEPFANRYGITQENNRIVLRTERGERSFRVVGVYYDYAADQGAILMRRELYTQYWDSGGVTGLAIYLTPDTPAQEVINQMRQKLAGRDLVINATGELRNTALAVFDRTFAITSALNLLATVVAFIGVLSALMALQIERTRELGVLRANGMTHAQMWKMTLLETGLMGGLAGLFSLPTGYLLALILVKIINVRSFGWTIQLNLQWETFAQAMLVAVISSLLASIYPMLRLGKIQIAAAVRQE